MSKAAPKEVKYKYQYNFMFSNGVPLTITCDAISNMYGEHKDMMAFFKLSEKPGYKAAERRVRWQPFFVVNMRHVAWMGRVVL